MKPRLFSFEESYFNANFKFELAPFYTISHVKASKHFLWKVKTKEFLLSLRVGLIGF